MTLYVFEGFERWIRWKDPTVIFGALAVLTMVLSAAIFLTYGILETF